MGNTALGSRYQSILCIGYPKVLNHLHWHNPFSWVFKMCNKFAFFRCAFSSRFKIRRTYFPKVKSGNPFILNHLNHFSWNAHFFAQQFSTQNGFAKKCLFLRVIFVKVNGFQRTFNFLSNICNSTTWCRRFLKEAARMAPYYDLLMQRFSTRVPRYTEVLLILYLVL